MSEARVYVNGKEVCYSPYGYSPFYVDVTPFLNPEGESNTLAVRLENQPFSSRWYPGAGLFRNVHLITTDKVHVPVWGTHVMKGERLKLLLMTTMAMKLPALQPSKCQVKG